MTTPRATYTLTLVALTDDSRPAVTRLRQLLKFALRALRLRCVRVESATANETQPAQSQPPKGGITGCQR